MTWHGCQCLMRQDMRYVRIIEVYRWLITQGIRSVQVYRCLMTQGMRSVQVFRCLMTQGMRSVQVYRCLMSHDTGYVECRDCPLIFLSILSLSLGGLRLVTGFSLSWLSSDLSSGLGGRLTYNEKVILKVCIFTIRLCHKSSCLFSI